MDEIQSSKVTGEEDRYSHIDLVDFQANLDGSIEAFNVLGRHCGSPTPTWSRPWRTATRRW